MNISSPLTKRASNKPPTTEDETLIVDEEGEDEDVNEEGKDELAATAVLLASIRPDLV